MQVGPSKLILRAYLTNLSMDVVYGTFILHHLKLQPSQGSACETVLVYMTSLANLILVMPTEDAQPDDRLQRPALWHTLSLQTQTLLLTAASSTTQPLQKPMLLKMPSWLDNTWLLCKLWPNTR